MTKLLVVLLVVAAFLAFGGPRLLERASEAAPAVSELLDRDADPQGQSAAQLSAAEFLRLPHGSSQAAVEARVGRPERRYRVALERVELECWYYGIAGATGAYQLCFLGGKLNSKVGFGAAG
jgi:hypothetical protein